MALADTARLIASLELQDKFSATAAKYDKAIGGMERNTSRLGKIGSEVGRGTQAAVQNIAKVGIIAGGLIASQVVAGVKSLEQLATVTNQTEAAIKSTGGVANVTAEQVRDLSESLEELTTVDDKVIQEGANLLLTFKNIRNEVGEGNDVFNQAVDAANNLALAGFGDMTSASKQLGKALNDPIKGITALGRAGVTFTQKQKDQIALLVEQNDLLGAQKIILKEVESQVGESGEAFGKGPGADMRKFGDAIEGAQQALATGFLPVITRVSEEVQKVLGNPEVQAQIKEFGKGAAGSLDDLINVAGKLPWAAIGDAFRLLGTGSKAALDFFTGLPPWVQTAVLTGWGLNKLTGGALGNIVGELGKGLVKGVLGMNAGVVNITAGTVNGPGGGPAGGGRGGGLGGVAALAGGVVAAGTATAMVVDFGVKSSAKVDDINKQLDTLNRQSAPDITESIERVDTAIGTANKNIVTGIFGLNHAVTSRLEAERRELVTTRNDLARNIVRGTDSNARYLDRVNTNVALERAAANAYRAADATRIQGLRDSHASANAHLAAIERKPTSFTSNVTVNTAVGVEFSTSAAAVQIRRITQTTGNQQDFEALN